LTPIARSAGQDGTPSSPVTKSEPEPAITYGDANPRAELGAKLSRVAGAHTGLSPAFVQIGGIPTQSAAQLAAKGGDLGNALLCCGRGFKTEVIASPAMDDAVFCYWKRAA
jgi:hypothetical protein